jgi:hypothetical protein
MNHYSANVAIHILVNERRLKNSLDGLRNLKHEFGT